MPVAGGILIGAAIGGATAAITGGNILKGAAFGALGAGISSGIAGVIGGEAGAIAGGAEGALSAADTLGLQQMAADAGLTGQAAADFVSSGGTMGSTAAGGGGVGYGAEGGIVDAGTGLLNTTTEAPQVTQGGVTEASGNAAAPKPTEVGAPNAADQTSMLKKLQQELVGEGRVFEDDSSFPMGEGKAAAAPKGLMDTAMDWAKANTRLASGAMDAGGRAIAGAAQGVGNVQAVKIKAQLDLENKKKLEEFYRSFVQSGSAGGVGVNLGGPKGPTPPLRRPSGMPVYNNGLLNTGGR